MKKTILLFIVIVSSFVEAQIPVSKPDHILIVIFQNKDYLSIMNSPNAPYINSLIADTNTALLTQSYAITHPSQPNYLFLFSGSNQGITDDNIPTNTPFTTCNLGASLLAASKTFTGYSESMPNAGYLGNNTSLYYRKHNPWSDWQGIYTNNIPPSCNQPFSSFPTDYNLLPDVSIVVGNVIHCMHDGTIQQGDTWLQSTLDGYIQWAKTHNSLFILTFDEDASGSGNNRILTFFTGPMIKHGSYNVHTSHFNILRTIENIYGLPACGSSSVMVALDSIWKNGNVGIAKNSELRNSFSIWSIPSNGKLNITVNLSNTIKEANVSLSDFSGRKLLQKKINLEPGENSFGFDTHDISAGIYFVTIAGKEMNLTKKIIIE